MRSVTKLYILSIVTKLSEYTNKKLRSSKLSTECHAMLSVKGGGDGTFSSGSDKTSSSPSSSSTVLNTENVEMIWRHIQCSRYNK